LEYEVCINQLKWFAQFLLEGAVFSRLKPFVKHLLSPASLMTKQWAQCVVILFRQTSIYIFSKMPRFINFVEATYNFIECFCGMFACGYSLKHLKHLLCYKCMLIAESH